MHPDNILAVRAIDAHIPVRLYTITQSRIVLDRKGAGPALHVAPGWANGFVSREEAVAATDGWALAVWEDTDRNNLWGVTLPWNRINRGGKRNREQVYTSCPTCHQALPTSGMCDDHGRP